MGEDRRHPASAFQSYIDGPPRLPTVGDQFRTGIGNRNRILEVVRLDWDDEDQQLTIELKPVIEYATEVQQEEEEASAGEVEVISDLLQGTLWSSGKYDEAPPKKDM